MPPDEFGRWMAFFRVRDERVKKAARKGNRPRSKRIMQSHGPKSR